MFAHSSLGTSIVPWEPSHRVLFLHSLFSQMQVPFQQLVCVYVN